MELISAIRFYDREGMSTMELEFYKQGGKFYHDIKVLEGTELIGARYKIESKNMKEAFNIWNDKIYMKLVPTHMSEFYGLEELAIRLLILEFPTLENNKEKKYTIKNYLGRTSEFYVKVFYRE